MCQYHYYCLSWLKHHLVKTIIESYFTDFLQVDWDKDIEGENATFAVPYNCSASSGWLNFRYISRTSDLTQKQGSLAVSACRGDPHYIFFVEHYSYENWGDAELSFSCANPEDVQVRMSSSNALLNRKRK